jgi:N6-L-threonylcarbamoyladenine synthase
MRCNILAIETSCDETSAAVVINGKVLNNIIATQMVHQKYGGVVPELASRAHQQNIVTVVDAAMQKASIGLTELDAVAFTRGPGLLGSLLVGASFAKGLALGLRIPLIEVNHMQAHVLAHFIESPMPAFPFICLTVSGGHTQIKLVRDYLDMTVIGQTQDDAVGEAFDKAAKVMQLPYPGGPLIDAYAAKGNPVAFSFPGTDMPGLDFSFSGIKTAFLYFIRDETKKMPSFVQDNLFDICASIQRHLVDMLMSRLIAACEQTGIKEVAIAGGVSANSQLRSQLEKIGHHKGWRTFIPAFEYCTDNAAMIAIAAHYKFLRRDFSDLEIAPLARMPV